MGDFEELAAQLQKTPNSRPISRLIERFGSDANIPPARWFMLLKALPKAQDRLYNTALWLQRRRVLVANDDTRGWLAALQRDVAQVEKEHIAQDDAWLVDYGMFGAAAFAEKIGDTQSADALFERARVFVLKDGDAESDDIFGSVGEIVAVSPRFLQKMETLVPPANAGFCLLLGAGAPQLARVAGLKAALPFLKQLETAQTPHPDSRGNVPSVEAQWHEATIKTIRFAGADDPQLALELAQVLPKTSDYAGDSDADHALCEAAFFQTPEAAKAIWADALPRLDPSNAMRFLVRILPRDAAFARSLYEPIARNVDAMPLPDRAKAVGGPGFDMAAFAFYEARFNPARARFRLERAFTWAQNVPTAAGQTVTSFPDGLAPYARAMAVFDADRALAWAAKIKRDTDEPGNNFDVRLYIARWLALDTETRQNAGFQTDSWQE